MVKIAYISVYVQFESKYKSIYKNSRIISLLIFVFWGQIKKEKTTIEVIGDLMVKGMC